MEKIKLGSRSRLVSEHSEKIVFVKITKQSKTFQSNENPQSIKSTILSIFYFRHMSTTLFKTHQLLIQHIKKNHFHKKKHLIIDLRLA